MPFQVSPGVNVSEIDLTTVVPAVSTTEGAIAGIFRWGPLDKRVLIDSENALVQRFGTPHKNFAEETFFTAASFLSYGNKLYVVRVANTTTDTVNVGTLSAFANVGAVSNLVAQIVKNEEHYEDMDGNFDADVLYVARYPGTIGNSLRISVCDSANAYQSNLLLANATNDHTGEFVANSTALTVTVTGNSATFNTNTGIDANGFISIASNFIANGTTVKYLTAAGNTAPTGLTNNTIYTVIFSNSTGIQVSSNSSVAGLITPTPKSVSESHTLVAWSLAQTAVIAAQTSISTGDLVKVGNGSIGEQYLKITNVSSISTTNTTLSFTLTSSDRYRLREAYTTNTINRYWEFYNTVDSAPGQSEYVAEFGNTSANDLMHVIVVDENGRFTGVGGTILEAYRNLSRADDAKTADGGALYYKTVINEQSKYIWFANDRAGAVHNNAVNIVSSTNQAPLNIQFNSGQDGYGELNAPLSVIAAGYDKFVSAEDVDVSLILQGKGKSNAD